VSFLAAVGSSGEVEKNVLGETGRSTEGKKRRSREEVSPCMRRKGKRKSSSSK